MIAMKAHPDFWTPPQGHYNPPPQPHHSDAHVVAHPSAPTQRNENVPSGKFHDPWANADHMSAHGDTVHISQEAAQAFTTLSPQEKRVQVSMKIEEQKEQNQPPKSADEKFKEMTSYNEWYYNVVQAPHDSFNKAAAKATEEVVNGAGNVLGVGSIKNNIKVLESDASLVQKLKAGVEIAGDVASDIVAPEEKAGVLVVKTAGKEAEKILTKDTVKEVNGFQAVVDTGKQAKHVPQSSGYVPGRSTLTADAQDLVDRFAGTGQWIEPNKERVNFGEVIGQHVDPQTKIAQDTTVGIIHYSKSGAHIVPARPVKPE